MTDRPWGMTLGALGVRRCTGQLTLRAEGKQYVIVFDHGAVVGARSPLASDSAVRVALLHHLIAPAQASEIARRITADPEREEIEVLAEVARLSLDQALRLRRKVIEQRAARTFAVDDGEFVIDSDVEIPIVTGLATDIRSVIYLGARMILSAQRLVDELRPYGPYFALDPAAADQLDYFGLTDAEKPILEALRTGTSLAELEVQHRELDPRTVQAVVYSLVSCSVCKGIAPPASSSEVRTMPRSASEPRATPGQTASPPRAPGPGQPAAPPAAPRPATPRQPSRAPTAAPDETGVPRSAPGTTRAPVLPSTPRTQTPLPTAIAPATAAAKAAGSGSGSGSGSSGNGGSSDGAAGAAATVEAPAASAGPAVPRATTPVADAPVPSRTRTPLAPARTKSAPFAGVAAVPGMGSLLRSRLTSMAAAASPPADPTPAEPIVTDPIAAGKSAFKRGQARLKVEDLEGAILELARAVELVPNEIDYAATLAWARFCIAPDKLELAPATREALNKAIRKSETPEIARFYLGRVERMLGRDKEALRHFQEVLEAQPKHADAAAEVRVIEARMAETGTRDSLFGRKR